LIDAYRRAYSRLADKVDLLLLEIGDKAPTAGQIFRMARYKDLLEQIGEELTGFTSLTRNEIERAAELGITLGERHARELISVTATGDVSIAAGFNRLPVDAIKNVLGFLDPQGPLYARLRLLAPHTASLVSDAIVSGVALGHNPRKIAGIVRDAFGGGLTDALRFTRTVQLYSYREANRATMFANQDVVEGWIWHAELGPRTCASCFANHGKVFPLSARLNDHHNGRCAAIPLVRGYENPVTETGEQWFGKQPEAFQKSVLGDSKYKAWKGGKFEFGRLTRETTDAVYGLMRSETPLKDLIQ